MTFLGPAIGFGPQSMGGYGSLFFFCLIWGFGGAFISLALSRIMAKWMMGVKVIDPQNASGFERDLMNRVHNYARAAGIKTMPEVGIFESPEPNAFATGPTKNRSLVAVSSGLLQRMTPAQVDGVLGHEIAHIQNGDMVTMTLVQGIVNAFVMFFARIIAMIVSGFVSNDSLRWMVRFAVIIGMEILLGLLGMIVVGFFSRMREYRADKGGAKLAGRQNMIGALEALAANYSIKDEEQPESLATLKISGKSGGLMALLSTHPPLEDRIRRLRDANL